MKFTLSWLQEHLQTKAKAEEIKEKLIDLGLEVESLINPAEALKDIGVARILTMDPHPNADRLRLCQVEVGSEKPVQVVCGASNARSGLYTAFVAPGGSIPLTGEVLKPAVIRGVKSEGMLCSARELGLAEGESEGILELPTSAKVGTKIGKLLGLDDPVFEVAITPNRSDCFSVRGIARDLAAAGLGSLKPRLSTTLQGSFACPVEIKEELSDKQLCPYFIGRVIEGVKNRPSPDWLQRRLKAIGLRPVSALVDILNYIMIDLGRPMHVFDADKFKGKVSISYARQNESFVALNGKEYTLSPSMVVIRDQEKILSLAGIMGGSSSACEETTTRVFLESALFDPINIAQSGRALNLLSDSRTRFERGVDPALVVKGLDLATQLILEHCGGRASTLLTLGSEPKRSKTIKLQRKKVYAYSGIDVASAPLILEKLGFKDEEGKPPVWHQQDELKGNKLDKDIVEVEVPSWRHDIHQEVDLIEEILRLHGYNKIPLVPLPLAGYVSYQPSKLAITKRILANRGLFETCTWSFVSKKVAQLFSNERPLLSLKNPLNMEMEVMRPSLLPNLLMACQRNLDRGQEEVALFEAHFQFEDATIEGQRTVAAGVRAGQSSSSRPWQVKEQAVDIFDVKADVLSVLDYWEIEEKKLRYDRSKALAWYHPGCSSALLMNGHTMVASFGQVHPHILTQLGFDGPMFGFEIFLDALAEVSTKVPRPALHLSPLQPVKRDFAFNVEEKVEAASLIRAARNADKRVTEVSLFDVYQGKGIEAGYKSLAIRVTIQPQEQTLTEKELQDISAQIIAQVEKACGGKLRV